MVLSIVNSIFAWSIVVFSIVGYFLTIKKRGERWMFWVVLASGWALFAIAQTIIWAGGQDNSPLIWAIWLSSYVLIVCSLVLIFLKLVDFRKRKDSE
jgi:RsiW-degrading membrane proteinase PrsW (M82 family)